MSREREDWGRFAAKAAVLAVVVMAAAFVGNRIASARDGVPGGPPRTAFTVAGTLTGVTGAVSAVFTFQNTGSSVTCTPPAVTITPDATTGAYSVEVDTESCSGALFNGGNVTVSVSLGDAGVVVRNANVNPVPYALYAQQYGTPDCPVGYERISDSAAGFPPGDATPRRLCRRATQGGAEDVVRVGSGVGAFWIDRFEATVNTQINGGGTYYFDAPAGASSIPPAPSSFPPSGQWGTTPFAVRPFALSVSGGSGRPPARGITWFQAAEACAASGKILPSRMQWLLAAQGTQGTGCNVAGEARMPGGDVACASTWGALDMVGNLWEWTDEWYAGAGSSVVLDLSSAQPRADAGVDVVPPLAPTLTNIGSTPWPAGYGDDTTYNVNAYTQRATDNVSGLPAAAARGGSRSIGGAAGVFSLLLIHAPSSSATDLGFRCAIPR